MECRENLQHQEYAHYVSLDTTLAVRGRPHDPNNHLANVLVEINNQTSAQTQMVRPVSKTTITFDVKIE